MYFVVVAQAACAGLFATACTGIGDFNTSFAQLGEVLLSTMVLIGAIVMSTQVGGMGIQKPLRQIALLLGVGAFFLKGYLTVTTGTLALF